jgi:hypothetical protein
MLLVLKFLKLLAVFATFAGAVGAFVPTTHADRRISALALFAPGLGATWTLGFLLAQMVGVSLLSGWVIGALVLSMASMLLVLFGVARDGRRSLGLALLALAPLVGTVALMVWRPE